MRILLIGSGGREHALCWKLAQSPRVEKIFTAPGNPGTAQIEKNENISIATTDLDALLGFASTEGIDLTVVGPEQPLAEGIVDRFQQRGLQIFGPTQAAAQLESSKQFAKNRMDEAGVPTAKYQVLTSNENAQIFLQKNASYPIVLKADGLAAGKGVSICQSREEAEDYVRQVMEQKIFGSAGAKIVAEEFLEGPEVSFFVLANGREFLALTSAQDHKALEEGDKGPNTGGMGAYSPTPLFSKELQNQVEQTVVTPLLNHMADRGTPFLGVLYVGLILTAEGPKVLEFNVRFGDPEAQVVLPRIHTDFAELLLHITRGQVRNANAIWSMESAMTVVLAASGYPLSPRKGDPILGWDQPQTHATLFHAGTRLEGNQLITSGGRVLCVTGTGETLEEAARNTYAGVEQIQFEGKTFRRDIGWRVLKEKT